MESTTLVHTPTSAELFKQAEAETEQRKDELVLTGCDLWLEAACRHGVANKSFVYKSRRGNDSFLPIDFVNTSPAFISKLEIDREVTSEKIDRFHLSLNTGDVTLKYICSVEGKRRDGTVTLGAEFNSLFCSIMGMHEQNSLQLLVELIIEPGTTKGVCFPKLTSSTGWKYWSKTCNSTLKQLDCVEAKKEYIYDHIEHLNTQLLGAA